MAPKKRESKFFADGAAAAEQQPPVFAAVAGAVSPAGEGGPRSFKRARFRIPKDDDGVSKMVIDLDSSPAPPQTPAQPSASKGGISQTTLSTPKKASPQNTGATVGNDASPPLAQKILATPSPAVAAVSPAAATAGRSPLTNASPMSSLAAASPAATPPTAGNKGLASIMGLAKAADSPKQPAPSLPLVSPAKSTETLASPAAATATPPRAKGKGKGKASKATTPEVSEAKNPNLPLDGVTMCFTGELDSITRADAEEKVKAAGGKVMGSVSSKTGYLVVGSHLDDGRKVEETSKYRKYEELKAKGANHPKLLDEQQLLAMLPGAAPQAAQAVPPATPASTGAVAAVAASVASSSSATVPASARPAASGAASSSTSELKSWVDQHAPRGFGELIGNAPAVKKLSEWLRDWENVVLRGQKKSVPFRPGGGRPDNVNARAALVSGPPGIGKTTTARLVAQSHGGYEVLEYNASDARGQKVIQEMAEGIADNKTISFGKPNDVAAFGHKITKKAVIIMDEVDGMGAGDRGGNAALIKMIKKTKNPIICICNDQGSQKVRSLADNCYDLKFTRPTKTLIAQRCAAIARSEGLEVEPNALEALAESCGSDMRMVLNHLQMIGRSPLYRTVGVKYMDMKERMHEFTKDQDIMLTPFDACKKLLITSERSRLSFRDTLDMFFVDHSLVGLLVQENYLRAVEKKPCDVALLNRCAYAADLMTIGDIENAAIRDFQNWSLLPDMGVTSSTFPSSITNGFIAFPSFPQFLGKYSTASRARRLAGELQTHLRLSSSVRSSSLLTSGYGDLLYRKAMRPLLRGDADAVSVSAGVLDAYGLRKEHLQEHLSELNQHLVGGEDLFKSVDSKVKAAMTREFNSGHHVMKVNLPSNKKRKVEKAMPDGDDEDDDIGGLVADEEDKSDDDVGGMVKKAKASAKGKAKAKAKGEPKAKAAGRRK